MVLKKLCMEHKNKQTKRLDLSHSFQNIKNTIDGYWQ
jgi:hypothetical protein